MFDGSQSVAELDSQGNVLSSTLYGADGLEGRGTADTLAQTYDPQGNAVEAVGRAVGTLQGVRVSNVYAYDAFGGYRQFIADGASPSAPVSYDPVGFGGQFGYYHDLRDRYLLGHRYYDSYTGRFVTRDPIGYGGGINLYGFTGNNPVNESDPSGFSISPLGGHPVDPRGSKWYPQNWSQAWAREVDNLRTFGQSTGALLDSIAGTDGPNTEDDCGCGTPEAKPVIKRGPKAKGTGLHNAKISQRIQQLKKDHPTWTHENGSSKVEESIQTPGGFKSRRRPDITFKKPDGTFYRENVGKTLKDGSTIPRERKALDDMEKATGTRPDFTPYDR